MSISKITSDYPAEYKTRNIQKILFDKNFETIAISNEASYRKKHTHAAAQISAIEIYEQMVKRNNDKLNLKPADISEETTSSLISSEEALEQPVDMESKTDTEIIVKPDGSRVLVVTMNFGGIETTMSLEISKPTAIQNANPIVFDETNTTPNISNER
ncbi:MAG: hypothetical protein HFI05_05895 [Lachnospiraceae bacterium]|jgi:hypothetical protein|nr:hypothetical protein [Lachnospiraceae bacterium]